MDETFCNRCCSINPDFITCGQHKSNKNWVAIFDPQRTKLFALTRKPNQSDFVVLVGETFRNRLHSIGSNFIV